MPDEPKNEVVPEQNATTLNPLPTPTSPEIAEQLATPNTVSSEPVAPAPEVPVTPTPPVTPGFNPINPVPASPAPKKSRKGLIITLVAAGVVALLVGGSALAYNFWYQNPNKVVTDALVNALAAKTMSATGVVDMKSKDYSMKLELSAKNSLEARSQLAAKVTFSSKDVDITVDGEAIYGTDGDIYLKLKDAAKLAASLEEQSNGQLSLKAFDGIIKKIDNKWVKIGKEDLGDVNKEYEKAQQCVADISKKLDSDSSFRSTVEKETRELYKSHPFIVIDKKLGSKTVNGQGSLGYSLDGSTKEAKAFVSGFGKTELGKKFTECNKDINFEDIAKSFEEQESKSNGTATAELWVSRFGHTITEFNIKGEDDGTKTSMVFNPQFNKNDKVEVPSDFVPFSELKKDIENLFGGYSPYEASDDDFNASRTGTEFN